MKAHLETLLATTDAVERLASDPLGVARRYTRPDDLEIAALVASSLAFGQVATIRARVTRVLDALGDRPAQAARERTLAQHRRALRGFVHRVWRGDDVAWLIAGAGGVARADGSLGAAFVKGHDEARAVGASDGEQLRLALASFVDRLMGASGAPTPPPRGLRHLLPDPRAGSACKRLLLFLRWMIRPADGVDLGLWPVAPSVLLVPVDTHIHRIALNLRMTSRTDVSWRTAEEITAALRKLDPDDPVRFDFALCHFGISRQCPSQRDDARCGRCVLRPVCRHWSGPAVP
ncbi:MAG: TIGR02757 family protein [Deltaproteobacteria bacterium]|nr:TIGR02757 family protein [Deltaproteobacteria bacterium]